MYLVFILLGAVILFRVVRIQFTNKDTMVKQAAALKTQMRTIEASRGNIYSDNYSLLATSIPLYELRMDMKADGLTDENLNANIDSLAYSLSNLFRDKSKQKYKEILVNARREGNRYLALQKKVKHGELLKLKQFPLFKLGKNKSGLIIIKESKRSRPYGYLAARTIGYERVEPGTKDTTRAGLEGAYSKYLAGINGQQLMQKTGNRWKPVSEKYSVIPKDGADVISTIDIHLQAVAENALETQLKLHEAKSGCVIVMEVETGYIKAMANLSLDEEGQYYEYFNHAIGTSMEPGSVIKLASTIVALENNIVEPSTIIHTGNGSYMYYDYEMKDTKAHGDITFEQAFVMSSNIGISRPIVEAFRKKPHQFVEGMKKLGVHLPLGIDLRGEANPLVKDPSNRKAGWSGTTLPQMSIGYEIKQTPLQTLALYNAVANNGKMVKPQFVKEIRRGTRTIKKFEPVVLNEKICSDRTLKQVRHMMELVVSSDEGTARRLRDTHFKIAGKTGTAQIYDRGTYKSGKYLASFAGYFPADEPKYSCIVVIRETTSGQIYGAEISAPVFKEIAEKIYSRKLELHQYQNSPFRKMASAPRLKNTKYNDAQMLAREMNLKYVATNNDADWVRAGNEGKKIKMDELKVLENTVPDVIGMGLKDALHVLGQNHLKVSVRGVGTVYRQSVPGGNKAYKGQRILIELK